MKVGVGAADKKGSSRKLRGIREDNEGMIKVEKVIQEISSQQNDPVLAKQIQHGEWAGSCAA